MTEPADRGRQAERTVLAYWRTELATVVVAMLMVRQTDAGGERVAVAVGVTVAIAVGVAAGVRRQRRLLGGATGADPVVASAIATAVALLQLLAVAVVL